MPSNDDMQPQSERAMKSRANGDAVVASVLPDEHTAGTVETTANEASTDGVGIEPLSSYRGLPQEFTFFQKKKRADQAFLGSSVAYASTARVSAFAARLDSAVAVNAKTHRHIVELMNLMSDIALTEKADVSKPTRKRLCWSKCLFYGCLTGFGAGWFLLFPSGRDLITQLAAFLVR